MPRMTKAQWCKLASTLRRQVDVLEAQLAELREINDRQLRIINEVKLKITYLGEENARLTGQKPNQEVKHEW